MSKQVGVDNTMHALSQDQFDCEKTKRECLVAADCDRDKGEACEAAFHTCEEPVRAERDKVHKMCRSQRESCEAAATDDNARHACHMAEHRCTLPVEPPEAVCRVDEEECIWAANGMMMPEPPMPPMPMTPPIPPEESEAVKACHDTARNCRESKHLDPKSLPEPPHCAPPPRPACKPMGPGAPHGMQPATPTTTTPTTAPAMTQDHFACERTKRECQIAADCDADKRETCDADFRACDEPSRQEHQRVHDMCHAAKETCDAAATDDGARHDCQLREHKCMLPVEPPEAVCHTDAEECIWQANGMTMPEPMMPPPQMSDAQKACHEQEHACVESKRMHPEDLPQPPHCEPPPPPPCMP